MIVERAGDVEALSTVLGPRFKIVVAPGLKTRGRTAYAPLHRAAGDRELVYLAMDRGPDGEGLAYRVAELIGVPRHNLRRVVFPNLFPATVAAAIEAPVGFDPSMYQLFLKSVADRRKAKKIRRSFRPTTSRKLDKPCPKCGGTLVYRMGRLGRFAGCSDYLNCKPSRGNP